LQNNGPDKLFERNAVPGECWGGKISNRSPTKPMRRDIPEKRARGPRHPGEKKVPDSLKKKKKAGYPQKVRQKPTGQRR